MKTKKMSERSIVLQKKTMLIKLSTGKTVNEAAVALQAAVQANHYGVMQVHIE